MGCCIGTCFYANRALPSHAPSYGPALDNGCSGAREQAGISPSPNNAKYAFYKTIFATTIAISTFIEAQCFLLLEFELNVLRLNPGLGMMFRIPVKLNVPILLAVLISTNIHKHTA